MTSSRLTAEIIIPSYNRLTALRKTLCRIRTLYPHLNICLGLQGELPDDEFQSQLNSDSLLRIEKLPVPSVTLTLNHCIASSRADIVLILDDDAIPHFGWFEAHLQTFIENPDLTYTSGRVVEFKKGRSALSEWTRINVEWLVGLFLRSDKKINGRIIGWINRAGLILSNYDQPGTCTINSPREGNMGLRRDLFLKIGGFNTAYIGNAWGFGAEFGLRSAREGRYGRYVGDAIIVHHEIRTGGTRTADKRRWFADFIHNHKILIHTLGQQAWIGSLPRLIKKRFSG